jgi:putative cardiolipin synthase
MHNKLFVTDNAAAIMGGRNVGDEYFQASSETNFGDFDVLTVGPIAKQLSTRFDEFWNSELAIPVQALLLAKPPGEGLQQYRAELERNLATMEGSAYMQKLGNAPALATLIGRDQNLVWAKAEVLYDSPEKGKVQDGEVQGTLLRKRLGQAIRDVKSELDIVSPYLVPGDGGMRLLEDLRARGVRVRVLTNSLASTDMPIVHAGYRHYRNRMLEHDIELYEVRPLPGAPDTGGGSLTSPSSGQFALHAKVFLLDGTRLFIGSMNFDRRSLRLNTEIGLLIDSPDLARQVTARFNEIAQPANCYVVALRSADQNGRRATTWRTEEQGKNIESTTEPMTDLIRGIKTDLLTLLPIDDLL